MVTRRACGWRTRQFPHLQPPFPLQILPRKSIKSFFLAFVVLVDISRSHPVHTSFLFIRFSAVPGARTQTTLPLSPPQSNMAPPSEDNGKVKKDITKLPWRCAHHIRVIYTVNCMLLCLGYGCSSASPPFKTRSASIRLLLLMLYDYHIIYI